MTTKTWTAERYLIEVGPIVEDCERRGIAVTKPVADHFGVSSARASQLIREFRRLRDAPQLVEQERAEVAEREALRGFPDRVRNLPEGALVYVIYRPFGRIEGRIAHRPYSGQTVVRFGEGNQELLVSTDGSIQRDIVDVLLCEPDAK